MVVFFGKVFEQRLAIGVGSNGLLIDKRIIIDGMGHTAGSVHPWEFKNIMRSFEISKRI